MADSSGTQEKKAFLNVRQNNNNHFGLKKGKRPTVSVGDNLTRSLTNDKQPLTCRRITPRNPTLFQSCIPSFGFHAVQTGPYSLKLQS